MMHFAYSRWDEARQGYDLWIDDQEATFRTYIGDDVLEGLGWKRTGNWEVSEISSEGEIEAAEVVPLVKRYRMNYTDSGLRHHWKIVTEETLRIYQSMGHNGIRVTSYRRVADDKPLSKR